MVPLQLALREDWRGAAPADILALETYGSAQGDELALSFELLFPARTEDSPGDPCTISGRIPLPEPRMAPEVRPPARAKTPPARSDTRPWLAVAILVSLTSGTIGWTLWSGDAVCRPPEQQVAGFIPETLADLIVHAESNGRADAKNERSSATGAGQFIDGTWLELVSTHRPDLKNASQEKVLALRKDTGLSHDMVVRLAERNARILTSRCLPVTPGTLYLAHFAGGGGAASVLSSPDHADAAAAMAKGDSRGKLTREKILAANPFLKSFTVEKLKSWADRKMQSAALIVARKS